MSAQKKLVLFTFIDALGWEVLQGRRFMESEVPYRQKLTSVFGYSSACVPSILSGLTPAEHGHWSFYYYDEDRSPFAPYRWMQYLPFQNRGRVRNKLSQVVKKDLGWDGYFQLYNMPFDQLDKFDYCEKRNIFAPGGLNQGQTIVDQLEASGTPYHISDWHQSEVENLQSLKTSIQQDNIEFAFLYMADMDALLHNVGKHSPLVDEKLNWYEEQLKDVLQVADQHYDEVQFHICSDHGMATVTESVNLGAHIEKTGLVFGVDYMAAYDSTMARFWFLKDSAKSIIARSLNSVLQGDIVSDHELDQWGCQFDNQQYGELIFLMHPGVIICPSHMGTKPITGMHGYSPLDADSDAVLLSSNLPSIQVEGITDLNALMHSELKTAAQSTPSPISLSALTCVG